MCSCAVCKWTQYMDEIENPEYREEFLKKFGAHLRELREKKGVKAIELASWCDIKKSALSRIENGGTNPSLLLLNKIAHAFDMSLSELFKGMK